MITFAEVESLREAIPPRHPRGSLENKKRLGPVRRFNAAVKQYRAEHGHSWFRALRMYWR